MGLVVTQVPVKHCQECMHAPITPSLLKWMQAITPVAPLSCCRTPQWDVSVVGKTLRVYAETQQSASLSNWLTELLWTGWSRKALITCCVIQASICPEFWSESHTGRRRLVHHSQTDRWPEHLLSGWSQSTLYVTFSVVQMSSSLNLGVKQQAVGNSGNIFSQCIDPGG